MWWYVSFRAGVNILGHFLPNKRKVTLPRFPESENDFLLEKSQWSPCGSDDLGLLSYLLIEALRNRNVQSQAIAWMSVDSLQNKPLGPKIKGVAMNMFTFRKENYLNNVGHLVQISTWPSDAIWHHKSWSTFDKVLVCCLTATSHYLNQCWLIIKHVLWHWSERNFTKWVRGLNFQINSISKGLMT